MDRSRWLHSRLCCAILVGRWDLRPQLGNRRLANLKGPGAIHSDDMHACYTSPIIFHLPDSGVTLGKDGCLQIKELM